MEPHVPSDDNSDASTLHQALVDKLKSEGLIRTSRIETAFCALPRHLFLPGVALDQVYSDKVIIIKRLNGLPVSTSSQPAAMAIMLEQLQLEPGHRVLEIGAGSGYNAALMAHIVGDTGRVVTVDIDEDLVESAREHLSAAGFDRVQVVCGDGGFGYPSAAPYDRIILTVGTWDIAPAWREQLKPGGWLLLPLSIRGVQRTVAFEHVASHLSSVSISCCSFIMLRGAFAGPEGDIQLGPEPGLYLSVEDCNLIDAEATYKLLTSPSRDWPTTIRVTPGEIWESLSLWLALREPSFCSLNAEGESAECGIVPYLFGLPGKFCGAVGLLGKASMCMLMCPPGQPPLEQPDVSPPFELFVRSFGLDDTLAHRLIEQVTAWDTAGRPSTEVLRIRAYPQNGEYVPSANDLVIQKRWTRLVLDWQLMEKLSTSIKIYIGLVITLAILGAINVFLPQGSFLPTLEGQELPAPKSVLALVNAGMVLILYGGLGFLGLQLSQKLGFANIWDPMVSNRQRFLIPALIGIGLGVFLIVADTILSKFHASGPLPHPPFPTSLVASAAAGIGEELIFRLFFIPFWVWLISHVALKKKWQNQIFWVVAILSALAFAFGHIPSVMVLFGWKTIGEIPPALMSEIVLLNSIVSIFAAYYFRRFGFLAPVGIHFWTDVVWHVIWGVI